MEGRQYCYCSNAADDDDDIDANQTCGSFE